MKSSIVLLICAVVLLGAGVGMLSWKMERLAGRVAELESRENSAPVPAAAPVAATPQLDAAYLARLKRVEERITLMEEALDKKILHDAMAPQFKLKAVRDLPGK